MNGWDAVPYIEYKTFSIAAQDAKWDIPAIGQLNIADQVPSAIRTVFNFDPVTSYFQKSAFFTELESYALVSSVSRFRSGIGRLASLVALPGDNKYSEDDCPRCDSFRPRDEYVPPWQVISNACAFFYAGFLLFRRRGESGAIFLAMALIFFSGVMLLVGYESYSPEDYRGPDYPSPMTKQSLHNREIVPQKHLTDNNYRGTVITRENLMAVRSNRHWMRSERQSYRSLEALKAKTQKRKPSRAGRPPLPEGNAKATMLRVRVTPDERAAFEAAAKVKNQTVSQWIRCTLSAALEG